MEMNEPSPRFAPELIQSLRSARFIAVLTGAGVSAESGVPTFRDAQTGFWEKYDPQQLASASAFLRNPKLVWEWYEWRRGLVANASPNPAHAALAAMEAHVPNFILITQNVDGLHQVAGSKNMVELHGNIWRSICFSERTLVQGWENLEGRPPRCPNCGSYLRPDVVWFGESLPEQAIRRAWNAAQQYEIFFSIGTSGLVHPAATLPRVAAQHGKCVIEINPAETPITPFARWSLRGAAGIVLPALVNITWEHESG